MPVDVVVTNLDGNTGKLVDGFTYLPSLPSVGTSIQGGYLGAYISLTQDGVATHGLIVADKSTEFTTTWGSSGTLWQDQIDGTGNFASQLSASNASAVAVESNLNAVSHGGFNDWYIPAIAELLAIYAELKPVTNNNETADTSHSWYVPSRGAFTATDPGQTSVSVFQVGGAQAFEASAETGVDTKAYWSSTTDSASNRALGVGFFGANYTSFFRTFSFIRVRAIRRVAVANL